MPPSRYSLKRSEAARLDLAEIRTYTIQQYDVAQWQVYQGRLNTAIQQLRLDPVLLGQACDHIKPGYYRYHIGKPKGRHYIYYYLDDKTLVIDRVIHDSRDQERQFL